MQTLIIYASIHHNNTEAIANVIGDELNTKPLPFIKVSVDDILNADLVGFGSGIYWGVFHEGIINLITNLPDMHTKKCFIFSSAGMKKNFLINRGHKHIKNLLSNKGFEIVGEFDCLGYDTNGFLKHIGGLNKGRPNQKDFDSAIKFAQNIKKSIDN